MALIVRFSLDPALTICSDNDPEAQGHCADAVQSSSRILSATWCRNSSSRRKHISLMAPSHRLEYTDNTTLNSAFLQYATVILSSFDPTTRAHREAVYYLRD